MRRLLIIMCLAIGIPIVSPVLADEIRDPETHFFNQSFGDLGEEAQTAKNSGKKGLFVMFHKTDCPWCAKMKVNIMNHSIVQDYFREHFINIQIDTDGSEMITGFDGKEVMEKEFALKHNRIRATPVFLFFDINGKQLVKYTGATRDIREFMWLGEYIVGEHYKNKRFAIFKREQQRILENKSKG